MPRIRTIKPEFWTDEKLTECSLIARLLFIGLLNFADDNGNIVFSAKRMKMQIFPADNLEVSPLLSDLIAQGVLMEYSANGQKFLHIKGFLKHQVINRRSATNIPKPVFSDDSVSAHAPLTEHSVPEGKGSGVGKEKELKNQKKKTVSKKGLLTLSDWMVQNPEPDYSAVYDYATKIGLPPAFLDVAFFEFEETFSANGTSSGKKYADWKLVVLKYLRGNWLKLWYQDAESKEWRLNTAGLQAQAAMLASAVSEPAVQS